MIQDYLKGLWHLPPWFQRSAEARCMEREALRGGPKRSLQEAVEMNLEMLKMPKPWDFYQGLLHTEIGTSSERGRQQNPQGKPV